jgi:guanylate kinase
MSLENNSNKLVVVAGPSCVGKTTIIDKFIQENPSFQKLVTDTTRPPRNDEQNGIDYHFRTLQEFQELEESNYYAEVAEYRPSDYKAISRYYFDNLINGQSYICAITPEIAVDFCSHLTRLDQSLIDQIKPKIIPVYIGVSNLITLYRRSQDRQPPVSKSEFKSTFKKDYSCWKSFRSNFSNLILNDTTVDNAVSQLEDIIIRNQQTKKPSN